VLNSDLKETRSNPVYFRKDTPASTKNFGGFGSF